MKTLQQLYTELGITGGQTKTAAANKEDAVIDFLKKIAEGDAQGEQKVPTDLGQAAASRENGTGDPSQALAAFNSRANKPEKTDSSTLNASTIPAMTQGTTSHKLNEIPQQGPAQAASGDTTAKEVLARANDVDLDTVFKVAYINDYLGRQAAQAAMMNQQYMGKSAQQMDLPPAQSAGAGGAGDPTEEIMGMLGQVSADELVAKKDQLLAAIADVLESSDDTGTAEAPAEEKAEGEAKEAAAKLLSLVQANPALKTKVAAMLSR